MLFRSNVKKVHRMGGVGFPPNFEELIQKGRKEKFYPMQGSGFDVYFVVPGGRDLQVNDVPLEVNSENKNDIRKAFMKTVNSRATNRVFLSRFCNSLCTQI